MTIYRHSESFWRDEDGMGLPTAVGIVSLLIEEAQARNLPDHITSLIVLTERLYGSLWESHAQREGLMPAGVFLERRLMTDHHIIELKIRSIDDEFGTILMGEAQAEQEAAEEEERKTVRGRFRLWARDKVDKLLAWVYTG